MLYTYSVTPLFEDHFDERVRDIITQCESGITYMPLFMMILIPEGNPVWDKAGKYCTIFRRYKKELDKRGIKSGILIQASFGHSYEIEPNPFQKYVNLTDGAECYTCCPEDEKFIEHFSGVMKQLAAEHPAAIMLDDDFRLMNRIGKGCACPLHMREFNRRSGLSFTREQLLEHINTHSPDDALTDLFREIQIDSLKKAATEFRKAIDEVDPSIQGINCTSGHICEGVTFTNKIFAGKGNPTIVRIPNGIYAPKGIRGISESFRQMAITKSKIKNGGINIVLAETDTIPFNRYAKSARFLHAHYLGSILGGAEGAKHWITSTRGYEPESGKIYRDILAKHSGMYDAVAKISKDVKFVGINSLFIEQERFRFEATNFRRYHEEYFVKLNFERMGLPYYFSDVAEGAVFLDGGIAKDMTDEQIKNTFENSSVFLAVDEAEELCRRGYGELLGVSIADWDLGRMSHEILDGDASLVMQKQKNSKKLVIESDTVRVCSTIVRSDEDEKTPLAPAVTQFNRDNGMITVTFSGTPNAEPTYTEGFSFLNELRKKQMITLLKRAGALPIYAVGDDEISLQAGYLPNGDLLAVFTEIGIDPLDELRIHLENKPVIIRSMMPDGSLEIVNFSALGDDIYSLDIRVESMYPVVLFVTFDKQTR